MFTGSDTSINVPCQKLRVWGVKSAEMRIFSCQNGEIEEWEGDRMTDWQGMGNVNRARQTENFKSIYFYSIKSVYLYKTICQWQK